VEVRRHRKPRGDGEMQTDSSWALVEVRRRRKPRGDGEMRTDSSWALGHKSVVTARLVKHGWVWIWVWVCQ
jgi:hypothetical protein